ncbi:MAG: tRNA lysidine(34) synthetase TilS [Capsulimonadaceae bacterium]|nr:tRNA lysidine(34) synthetase TilS [Capsulimonadaceae bacterium]
MKYSPGMALVETLDRTIETHGLFGPGDLVLVAVSGGPDSTALLHALKTKGVQIHAAHLNHGFRGPEAEADVAYVRGLCKELDVPLSYTYRNVPSIKKVEKGSSQMAARRVRYAYLEEVAAEVGARCIATAHNRDDRIETMLLNIVRGTGTDGLKGIPYCRPPYVRPLLDVSREEIEFYCEDNGLEPRRDSSNYSSLYARNNIRKELIPYLERRFNESVRSSLIRLSEIASAESDYLQEITRRWLAERPDIPVLDLLAEPVALQRRILREHIREMREDLQLTDISHEMVERIRESAGTSFVMMLPGADWLVCGDAASISMRRAPKPNEAIDLDVALPLDVPVSFLTWVVRVEELPEGVDPDSLRVRTWRSGDKLKMTVGTRKLQDIFTDAKIPRDDRRSWPVLVDDEGIVAVPNLAYAIRARGIVISLHRVATGDKAAVVG